MIIIHYQGTGASTMSSQYPEFIDLESSHFYVDGKRDPNWYKIYCSIATALSEQGNVVFVSSHKEVRETLKDSNESIYCLVPNLDYPNIKEKWLEKLSNRYLNTKLEKDKRALLNAEDRFTENVEEIIDMGFPCILTDPTISFHKLRRMIQEKR